MAYQNKTLGQLVAAAYNKAIASDGIDSVYSTVNGESYTENTQRGRMLRKFVDSKARQTLAFFFGPFMGFRNDSVSYDSDFDKYKREGLAWTLAKNLLWWPDKKMSTGWRVAQFVAMTLLWVTGIRPLYILAQTILTPVMNLARLVLEVFPAFAYAGFDELKERVRDRLADTNPRTKPSAAAYFFYEILDLFALDIPLAIFYTWHFIGRAIVSPIDGARQARKDGGLFRAILSGVLTTCAYVIGLPIVVAYGAVVGSTYITPFFANTVSPFLTANMPWLMTNAIEPALAFVSGLAGKATLWLTSKVVVQSVGGVINPVLSLLPESIVATFGLTAVSTAISSAATVALTTVGLGVSKAYDAIRFAISSSKSSGVADAPEPANGLLPFFGRGLDSYGEQEPLIAEHFSSVARSASSVARNASTTFGRSASKLASKASAASTAQVEVSSGEEIAHVRPPVRPRSGSF